MTQIATVEKLLQDGKAEVAVIRQSACSHDCASCPGCGAGGRVIRTVAVDCVGVHEGDRVVLYSRDGSVLGAAAVVYLLPLLFFLVGYGLSARLESLLLRILVVLAVTALGVLPAVALDRLGRGTRFEIREKL